SWSTRADAFPDQVRAEYVRALSTPATVHAICEEYRAAATIDCEHDAADMGKQPITCPVLVLWSKDGPLNEWYDPLAIWRQWAGDVRGESMAGGHLLPEELPEQTEKLLHEFFTEPCASKRQA